MTFFLCVPDSFLISLKIVSLQSTRKTLATILRTQIVISAHTFHSCYDFSFVPDSFLFSLLKDVVSWLSSIAPVIIRHRPMRDHGLSAPAHPSQLVCDEDLIIWRVWRVTRVVMWSVTGGVWRCHVSFSSEGVMAALSEIRGYGHEDCAITYTIWWHHWHCHCDAVTCDSEHHVWPGVVTRWSLGSKIWQQTVIGALINDLENRKLSPVVIGGVGDVCSALVKFLGTSQKPNSK